jgi:ATP-binding cassette subfamily B protein
LGFVLLVGASFIVMLPPIVVRHAIDDIEAGTTRTHLLKSVAIICALAAVESVVRFTSRVVVSATSRHIEYALRNDLATHLMRLDQPFYLKHQTGDLVARATNDMQRVRDLMGPSTLEIGQRQSRSLAAALPAAK